MSGPLNELAAVFFFVVTGWVALWPARRSMGPVAYHLSALPTGMLAGPVAGSFSTVSGRPLDLFSAFVGAALLAGAVHLALVVLNRRADERTAATPSVGPLSFGVAALSLAVVGAVLGLLRMTVTNNDSVMSYWPMGVELARKGAYTVSLLGARSPLIPTMHAVHVDFGSDWAYVIYPLMAATILGWIAFTLLEGPLSGASRRTASWVAGATVAALAIEPSFLFHSFFVHSDLVSGLYLFLALMCLGMAARRNGATAPARGADPATLDASYLVLAGLFTSGLALARPDGLAYMFVPVAVAIAVITRTVSSRGVAAYFGPLVAVLAVAYGAAYSTLGIWESGKLSGKTTLAILVLLGVSALSPWIVGWLDRRLPFRVAGDRFLSLLVTVSALLMMAAWTLKWDTASEALANAGINLFAGAGGYHYLWWMVVVVLVISVLTRDALRTGSWTRPPFLALMLFFVVAGIVHGLSHEGRIGVGDSFNRIAFHAIPLVFWYAGAVAARILGGKTAEESPAGA